jgi:hypothetical protein
VSYLTSDKGKFDYLAGPVDIAAARRERLVAVDEPATSHCAITVRTTLTLATGICLPANVAEWPLGARTAWNDAVVAGAFDKLFAKENVTIGMLSKAFLRHRINRMKR